MNRKAGGGQGADLGILLFTHDLDYGRIALESGCSALVIDWEHHGKGRRQLGVDTEINYGGAEDLVRMRQLTSGRLVCRVNNLPERRLVEVRQAVELGADEVWLPMVGQIRDVEECLEVLGDQAVLGVQVESDVGLGLGEALSQLPLARVYIGLNDLHISRGRKGHLFTPLTDGSLDAFRESYPGSLGVAGITQVNGGQPLPQRLLLAAMARLACDFGVARRSFRREVREKAMGMELARIQEVYQALTARSKAEVETDHENLSDFLAELACQNPIA